MMLLASGSLTWLLDITIFPWINQPSMAIFNSKTAQSSFRVQPRSLGEKEMAKLETQMGRRQQAEGYQHMYIYIHYIYIIYTIYV